ncbi:hypothetical protein GQ53DRAFT_128251 [Thozetella sp. PMI_491]|nr:hypothetical protein GQ53DRAFT_128251 [Thozetella sp. PMI_491]
MSAGLPAAEDGPAAALPSLDLPTPDLVHFLDADPSPTFLVPIDPTKPIPFQSCITNAAFRALGGAETLLGPETNEVLQFRSWVQAIVNWREAYHFAGRTWTAFSIQDRWKAVRGGINKEVLPEGVVATRMNSSPGPDAQVLMDSSSVMGARLESLQKMMEMSDVGVFEYHPSGTLIRANQSWYNLSRHPRELMAHQDFSFMDLVYPPDVPLVMSQWNRLSQGIPVTFEMRWKAPRREGSNYGDEESQWVLSACVPVLDAEGQLVSIAGNTIDISAQKSVQREALKRAEALERARTSEEKFARFAELAPVAIYIFDPQKGMQYCNHQFFELTGHPHVEPGEVDWTQLILPEDMWIVDEGWRVILQEKQPAQTQFRLQKKWNSGDGVLREVWAQGQSYPECDDEGNVVSVFGTLTDITRFKWAEDLQRSRVKEALEAKRQQENFIDMTSHEMRNPLSAVIQCADSSINALKQISGLVSEALLNNIDSNLEQVQEETKTCLDALQTIVSCSIHQKRVIDDVLTLSKLDSNLILITPIRVQPEAVVENALKMFELECSNENIDLSFARDPSMTSSGAVWVMMDPSRLLQILINLLTNAIKFSRGSLEKKIVVTLGISSHALPKVWKGITFAATRTTSQNILDNPEWGQGRKAYIWITVEDTGCGLAPAEQCNLFTRFSQATPRTHVQYGGSGLGLFISKSLAELQSGCIGVRSEAGVGSTFAFSVGTRETSPPGVPENDLARPNLERSLSIEEVVKAAHYSVLIVEDNIVNQKVLSQQLEKAGCNVQLAGHGEEALDFLKTTKFWHTQTTTGWDLSLVLMDIEMPVMDGITCVKQIRALQRSGEIVRHVPILAVSANVRSEQVRQALEAGMDDSIGKPFRVVELLPKIDQLARKAK